MSSTSPSIDGDQPVADQQDPSFSDLGVSSSLELDKVGSDSADLTSTAVVNEQKTSPRRFVGITLIALGLAGIALFGLHNTNDSQAFTPDAYQKSQLYKVQSVPLNDITSQLQANALQNAGSFSINGLLKVNKSIVLQPIASPSDAVQGQIYYDKNKNQLTYFNGSQFVYLQKSGTGTSIGGASGAIALTAGLSLSGNSLANTGVLSVNGQTGDVTFSGGSGISVSGSTIKNTGVTSFGGRTGSITLGNGLAMSGGQIRSTGVLSLSSGTPTLQITDDGSGNLTITNVGGGSGNVSTAGGTSGTLALFNGAAAIGDSIVSQSGTTVTVGGTLSATTLQGNGSGITNINASNISSGTLANTRLSASVTLQGNAFNAANELVQLNGTGGLPALDGSLLTNLNGSNISSGTVADARLSANVTKQGNVFNGVSQLVQTNGSGGLPALNGSLLTNLNASNVSSGTLSDTRLSANVTLQGNTFNVANALLQLDATGKIPALNGSLITSLNASNISSGTVNDARLSGNVPLLNSNNNFTGATLQHNGNNICDTTGNCAGTGGGVTTSGGTSGTLSLFTGAQTIGDSILSQSGTTVTVAGTLSATTLTGAGSGITSLNASNISSGTLADGRLSANVTLQGNAFNGANELVQLNGTAGLPALNGSLLTNLNATNIASGTLSDSRLSSNVALLNGNNNFTGATLQHNGNNVCDASGNCAGVGGGVTTSGGTTGTISLFTGAQSIGDSVLSQSGTTLTVAGTLSATTLTGAGSGITSLNASNVSSGTLADGRLSANVTLQGNTFNGNNQLVQLNGTGGLPALDGSLLTSLNASNISSGTLNDARLSANAALYNRATSNFTGALQQGGNNVCTTAGNCAGAGSGGGITNSGTQNYLTKTDGSGNITDSLIYDSGTQIGVKTNTPGYDFDVNGSANATTLYQNGNQVCDSSGLIAGCAGSGGNVSTTGGTTRKIAMFTGANAIGDSILAQNVAGDTITVGGTLSATDLQGDGSGITNINASNIATGTLADGRLSANVTLQGNSFNGNNQLLQLNGTAGIPALNGSLITSLNASNLSSGTVNDARLSANVTLQGNTFNGANQLVQLDASGFLPALNGSALTNLNATNVSSGTLSDGRLSSNVALLNANNAFTNTNSINTNSTLAFNVEQTGVHNNVLTIDTTNGVVGINQTPSSGVSLTVNGITQSSSIYASSGTNSNYFAKNYIVGTGGVSAGDVVVLANDGGSSAVIDTTTARDIRVMGVAGQTRIAGQVTNVAFAGNTSVNADTAAVAIGDQLVTSSTSGKVTVDNNATTGIVGYATSTKAGGSSGSVGIYVLPRTGVTNPTFAGNVTIQGGSGLTLSTALTVPNGGTGAITLGANGVLLGNGTSPITSLVAGSPNLCLESTAGAPVWAACTGGGAGGVTSLDTQSGVLTLANSSGSSGTITIDNAKADGSTKGIASFNSTNFSDNGAGVINTIQDIATTSSPTFATQTLTSSQATNPMFLVNNTNAGGTGNLLDLQLNGSSKFNVAPSGATIISAGLNVGANLQVGSPSVLGKVSIQGIATQVGLVVKGQTGQSSPLFEITDSNNNVNAQFGSGGNALTLGRIASSGTVTAGTLTLADGTTDNFGVTLQTNTLTGNATLSLPNTAGVNDTICLATLGNCVGTGGAGAAIGGSGTTNKLARFTGAGTIGDSSITDTGTSVSVNTSSNSTAAFQVQDTGSNNILNVDTSGGSVNTGYSAAPSFVAQGHNSGSGVNTIANYNPAAVGNLEVLTTKGSLNGRIVSVSGGNVSQWKLVTFNDGAIHEEMWMGVTTATGAQTITATYKGGSCVGACEMTVDEFSSSLGANTNWFATNASQRSNGASTTITYPSLTASEANGLYIGYGYTNGTGSAGATSGFTYSVLPSTSNVIAYNTSITKATTYSPTAVTTSAANDAVAAIITASSTSLNVNGSTFLGGPVTSPLILSGTTNTPMALQVQNATGTSIFNVDTAHNIVSVGTGTASTSPTYLFLPDAPNNAAGNALITGNWQSTNNWGIGSNSNTGDSTIRLGVTNSNTDTWNTTQNLNVLVAGTELVQPTTGNDSTTAFQVKNAAGRSLLNVDTSGSKTTFGNITSTGGAAVAGTLVLGDGTSDNFGATFNTTTLTANRTISLPDADGSVCLSSGNCLGGAGGGANTALSNLSSVAINTSLLPGVTNSIDAGSAAKAFRTGYFDTGLQAPLLQTAAGATSSGITITSGNASGGASGNISIDTGTYTSGSPTITLGGSNVKAVSIGNNSAGTTSTIIGGGTTQTVSNSGAQIKTFTNSPTGFTVLNASNDSLETIDTGSSKVYLGGTGASALSTEVHVADSTAAAQSVVAGSLFTTSTTTLQGGANGITLNTGARAAGSGGLYLATGNASAAAAGSITLDTGTNVDGAAATTPKTFESGLNNMVDGSGYSDTVSSSSDTAHGGSKSLKIVAGNTIWRVYDDQPFIINNIVPLHTYTFGAWIKAGSVSGTDDFTVNWSSNGLGGGGLTGSKIWGSGDDNSGDWTYITGSAVAPAGTNSLQIEIDGSTASVGDIHYVDDISVVDTSAINVGTTNAQSVNIGNSSMSGSTNLRGGTTSEILNNNGVTVKTDTNSIAAFDVQNASGASALTVDTVNNAVGINGTASPGDGANLYVHGGGGGNGGGVDIEADSYQAIRIVDGGNNQAFNVDTFNSKVTQTDTSIGLGVNNNSAGKLVSDSFDSGSYGLWSGGSSGGASIDASQHHSGKYSAELNMSSSTAYARTNFSSSSTTFSVGTWFRWHTIGASKMPLITLYQNSTPTNKVQLYLDPSWNLGVYNGATDLGVTADSFQPDDWVHIVMTINTTTGEIDLYAGNGSNPEITYTGLTIGTSWDTLQIGDSASNTGQFWLDDVSLDAGTAADISKGLYVQDSIHAAGSATFGGQVLIQGGSNSTKSFQVQNTAGNNVLSADTSGNQAILGAAGSLTGKLVFANSANSNTVSIVTASQANNVALTIPADTNTTDTICLQTLANCSGGGGGANTALSNLASTAINTDLQFDNTGNRSFNIAATGAGVTGRNLTIQGGNSGTGAVNGGNLVLQGGATGGSGITGSVIVKANGTDSASAFQVQNASNVGELTVDTANDQVLLGTASSKAGKLVFANSANGNTVSIVTASQANNVALTLPADTNPTDTFCLSTLNNCASNGPKEATEIVAMGTATGCSGTSPVASAISAGADFVSTSCTSAQTSINSAISALPSNGGSVYVRDGTYIIDGSITLASNVKLIGSGPNTILKLKDGINASIDMISGTTLTRVSISDLHLEGNKSNNSSGTQNGIKISAGSAPAPGYNIDRVDIENFRNQGISITGAGTAPSRITNSSFSSNTTDGINVSVALTTNTLISNNTFQSNGDDGLELGTNGSTVTGNTASSNTGYGLHINGSNDTVTGNTTISNTLYGIGLTNTGGNNTVTGNTVGSNAGGGILLSSVGGNKVVISNNILNDNGGSGANNSIQMNSGCDNDSVIGNVITDTAGTGHAINITSACSYTYLSSNQYSGTGATDIVDSGLATIWNGQNTSNNDLVLQGSGAVNVGGTAQGTATLTVNGGYNSTQLATIAQPTVTPTLGSATTWGYKVTALDGTGETVASTERTTAAGAATLDGTHFNTIKFVPEAGAVRYNIYRTTAGGTPSSTGLVTTITSGTLAATNGTASGLTNPVVISWADTGFAATTATPASNTTGGITLGGGFLTLAGSQTQDVTTAGAATATSLTMQPGTSTANSGTGAGLTLKAGNQTGTTSNGGALTLDAGTGTTANGAINIGTNVNSAINLGSTATNATITIGQYNGAGSSVISIGSNNGASTTQVVNIGESTSGITSTTIGSNSTTSNTTIQGGANGTNPTVSIQAGSSGVIAIGTISANTVQIGAVGSTNVASTIHIADTTAAIQTVTLGSKSSSSSTTIQGGTGNVAVTTGNNASGTAGNITFTTGTSSSGNASIIAKSGTNSTGAFQVQNTSNASLLTVDTANSNINLLGNNDSILSTWTTTTALSDTTGASSANRVRGGAIAAGGYMYYLGGLDGTGQVATAEYGKINADGTISSWTDTTALPNSRRHFNPVVMNGYIYVIGGCNSGNNADSTAYYAKINADGSIGTWNTTTALTAARATGATVSYNGYIYELGGWSGSCGGGGTMSNTIYYAKANPDGTLGSWTTNGTNLPSNLAIISNSTTIANGYLYIVGGYDGSTDTSSIRRVALTTSGALGSWTTQPTMLTSNEENSFTWVANGYLYAMQSDAGNTIQSFQLNSDGSVATGTTLTAFPVGHPGEGQPAQANGYLYALGGSSAADGGGTVSNSVYYASTSRVKVGGNLDLVGYSGENLVDGRSGGTLTAGNTTIVGTLQAQDDTNFARNVSIGGTLGVYGAAAFKNSSNSTSAFQVQDSAGTQVLNVDTTNNRVVVGSGSSNAKFYVVGSAQTGLRVNNTTSGNLVDLQNASGTAVSSVTFEGSLSLAANPSLNGAGTVTSNGTTAIVGSSTTFTTSQKVGDVLTISGDTCTIASITDATHLTCEATVPSHAGVTYTYVQAVTGSGTVSNSAGGTTLTGTTTNFLSAVKVGDVIVISTDGQTCTVSAIASNTSLTCASSITSLHSSVGYTYTASGSTDSIQLNANGQVGIGTSATSALSNALTVGGSVLFKNASNSTTAFQVQNTAGAGFLTADSINQIVTTKDLNIGSASDRSTNRVFTDGFESGSFNLYSSIVGGGTTTIDSAYVRNGKYAAKFSPSGSPAWVETPINGATTMTMRGYVYITSQTSGNEHLMALCTTSSCTTDFLLYRNSGNNKLTFWNGATSTGTDTSSVISTGAWHEIEADVTFNASTGTIDVYLDGVNVLSQTSQNTGATLPTYLSLGEDSSGKTSVAAIDDVVVGTVRPGDSSSLNVNDSLHVAGTSSFGGAMLVNPGSDSSVAFQVQNAAGNAELTVDSINNAVGIGKASTITGTLNFYNSGGANAVGIKAGASSAAYTLTLPTVAPAVNQCLTTDPSTATQLVFSSCTLQGAYTASTGGSTPEIKLDSTRGALDIQDANTSIAGSLFTVRGSNSGGLGSSIFDINSNGITTAHDLDAGSGSNISGTGRVFSDGFETGAFNQYSAVVGGGTTSIDTGTVRNGHYSAKFNPAGSAAYVRTAITGSTSMVMRAYIYVSSHTTNNEHIMALCTDSACTSSGEFLMYRSIASGKLAFFNGPNTSGVDGSTVLTLNTWHEIEADINFSTSGSTVMYLDGVQVYNIPSENNGGVNPTYLNVGEDATSRTSTAYFDDIVVDTVRPGDSSSVEVNDTLHVGGYSSFGSPVLVQSAINSATAFQVANASGNNVLSVDTTGNNTTLGKVSSVTGNLQFANSSSANLVTVNAGNTTGAYTLTLPTAGATGSLCLESTSGSTSSNTALQFISCGNSSTTMSHVADWQVSNNLTLTGPNPTTVGDLMVVSTSMAGGSVTGISGGGVTTWTKAVVNTGASGTTKRSEIWFGTVTATGASNIVITGETGNNEIVANEFTASGVTVNTVYGVDVSNTNNSSSSTVTFPSMVPQASGELYYGYGHTNSNASAGATSGFTYFTTSQSSFNDVITYNTNVSGNNAYQPTASQASNTTFDTTAAIFQPYITSTAINNSTSTQQGNFNVQAATSGTVAGVLQANASGTADILDLNNGSGTTVFSVGNTGNTLIKPSTNSTTALQVQNSSGTSLLSVDTTNSSLYLQNADLISPNGGIGTIMNLLGYSESFDINVQASVTNWVPSSGSITVSPDSTTAPNGATTADTLVNAVNSSQNMLQSYPQPGRPNTVPAGTYTFSVWLKQLSGASTSAICLFATGAASGPSTCAAGTTTVTPSSTAWTRYSVSQTFTGGSISSLSVEVLPGNGSIASVYAWGAQLVSGSAPGVYTHTEFNIDAQDYGFAAGNIYGNAGYFTGPVEISPVNSTNALVVSDDTNNRYFQVDTANDVTYMDTERIVIGSRTDDGGTNTDWTSDTTTAGTVCGQASVDTAKTSVVYNGSLYIGTSEQDKAEICQYNGGTTWTRINSAAGTFGSNANTDTVASMVVYNGYLYIGTTGGAAGTGVDAAKGSIYRWDGGTTFTLVNTTQGSFVSGGSTGMDSPTAMAVYDGTLFVGVSDAGGAEVYMYTGGTGTTNFLYASNTTGTFATTAGFNTIAQLIVYDGKLYMGANQTNKAYVFEYTGNDGGGTDDSWETTGGGGLGWFGPEAGSATQDEIDSMVVYNGDLYVAAANTSTGPNNARIFKMQDDSLASNIEWAEVNPTAGAFGAQTNVDFVKSMAVYNGNLFIGTSESNSAGVYRYDPTASTLFTLVSSSAGTVISGGTASIDTISTMIPFADNLFVGTSESNKAEIAQFSQIEGQSDRLLFRAASNNAGSTEQSGYPNEGSIYFAAEQDASNSIQNSSSGSFIFSNGIITNTGAYDVAEDYATRDTSLQPGDLVAIDPHETGFVRKASGTYDSGIVGVYSTNPALHLSQKDTTINGGRAVPVALAGRVPVKVSAENGPIVAGDPLTSSSTPGVAMKATDHGRIVGMAMGGFSGSGVGSVTAFVNPNYYAGVSNGSFLQNGDNASFTDLNVTGKTTLAGLNVSGDTTLANLDVTGDATFATLTVQDVTVGHITTNGITPTIEVDTDTCSKATATIKGTDTAGMISITTPEDCSANDKLAEITFAREFKDAPNISLTAANSDAVLIKTYIDSGATTGQKFSISAVTSTLNGNTTYKWYYQVIQ